MNPLEQATVQELIDELAKRCTACVVVTLRPDETGTDETVGMGTEGGDVVCLGLLSVARRHLMSRVSRG